MVTIGNTTLPGVQTTVESSRSVGVFVGSPGDVGVVGQADFTEGVADPNTVYRVTSATRAQTWFGPRSPLSQICIDALQEGAFPVYAAAPGSSSVSAEDITGAEIGTLLNAPVSEIAEDTVFTVNGTECETILTYDDPSNDSPDTATVHLNPVDGSYKTFEAPSASGEVNYQEYDYQTVVDEVRNEEGERIDFLASGTENEAVVGIVHDAVKEMEASYEFAIAVAGAFMPDVVAYDTPFDSSRMQFIYPSRNEDGESIIGSYIGLRAALGMSASPMRKRLASQRDLWTRLSVPDTEAVLEHQVNPIADESAGARIIDDVTTVLPTNPDESEMDQGIARIVVDYVTLVVESNADPFIGELHTQSARNTLQSIIKSELKDLLSQNAITGYNVSVQEVDAMTASVDVGVQTIKPLRNVMANVTAGRID